MKYILIIALLVLTAVLSRLYGPTDVAMTIPLSGENRFYGILIKNAVFWLEIILAMAVAGVYVFVKYV